MAPRLQLAATHAAVGDLLLDCTRGHIEMVRHSTEVVGCNAPVLTDAPDWYGDFLESWSGIATHARTWTEGIVPQVNVIPQIIADYGGSYMAFVSAAQPSLDRLATNASDGAARSALTAQLRTMLDRVNDNASAITALRTHIEVLGQQIGPDRKVLLDALKNGGNTISADLQAINNLAGKIDELKAKIKSLETLLTLNQVLLGLSVTLMAAGLATYFAAEGVGGVAACRVMAVVGGTGTSAISIYMIITLNQDISRLRNEIEADAAKMQRLHAQVLALKVFDKTVSDLIGATADGSSIMANNMAAWSAMAADIGALQMDLANAEKDLDAGMIYALRQDLRAAADHWQNVQPLAAGLASVTLTADPRPRDPNGQPITSGN